MQILVATLRGAVHQQQRAAAYAALLPSLAEMGGVKKHRLRIRSESEDLDSDSYPKPVCQQIFESESAPTSK